MHTGKKIIYWISLALICVFVIVPFVGQFTPLEFKNDDFPDTFEEARFYALPIAILLTLFGTLKTKDSTGTKTNKIILTICISLLSVLFLFMSVFSGMCRW